MLRCGLDNPCDRAAVAAASAGRGALLGPYDATRAADAGGRDRDRIIRHTIRTESEEFAKRLGLHIPEEGALTPEGLRAHRETYIATMREYNAGEGKRMRSWNLPFLIRHSAYHTMDHAWEMEDKDLS